MASNVARRRLIGVIASTMIGSLAGVGASASAAPSRPLVAVGAVDASSPAHSGRCPATARWEWGPAERVAPRRASESFDRARVRVRGGRIMAVWDVPRVGHLGQSLLRVSSRLAADRWSRPRTIARVPGFVSRYDLELGPAGTALVVWDFEGNQGSGHVMETHLEDGSWSSPHRLGDGTAGSPTGVIDGRGEMSVAWVSYPSGSRIDVSSRARRGDWGSVRHLARFGDAPVIAANPRGDLVVAWSGDGGAGVAIRRHRSGWQPVRSLKGAIGSPDSPEVAIGPGGRVLVMWSRSEDDETFTKRHLAWARTRFDGTWTRVRHLDTRSFVVLGTHASLSLSGHGRALAVWWSNAARGHEVRFSRFRFGHGWRKPQQLGQHWGSPYALLTPSGTAVAILGQTEDSASTRWGHQALGGRWDRRTLRSVPFVVDVHADDRRMVLLYNTPQLTARVLAIPAQ